MSTRGTTLGGLIGRGLRKRCPRCGEGKVFEGWFTMRDACPRCSYSFSREEGYWTGAMIVNIAVAEAWFFLLFVAIIVATLPDIAWQPLLIAAVLTNTLLPIFFYPYSKTLWMAIDLHFHKPEPTS